MVDDSRALQIAASLAEEEAMDLLTFLVSESMSGSKLSREDFLIVSGGIRDRLLVVSDYHRSRHARPASPGVERRLYTAEEASAVLTSHDRPVTHETVRRWAREGRLEGGWEQMPGGRRPQWVISPRSLIRCLELGVPPHDTYSNPKSVDEQAIGFLDSLLRPEVDT